MGAEIEWKIGILRIGPKFRKYGDPYKFSCVVTVMDGVAHLEGGSSGGPMTFLTSRDELHELFEREGIEYVEWYRLRNGKRHLVREKV